MQERSAKSEAIPGPAHPSDKSCVQPSAARLRAARPADLPALLALEARFPGDRLSPRQFRHHLASPRAVLRVLEAPDIAGYSLMLRHARRAAWRLYSMVVDPARRGEGLGARLLEDAIAQASAAGAPAITLEVREDNTAAKALYRGHGFRDVERREGYYEDGLAALCLRRTLGRL